MVVALPTTACRWRKGKSRDNSARSNGWRVKRSFYTGRREPECTIQLLRRARPPDSARASEISARPARNGAPQCFDDEPDRRRPRHHLRSIIASTREHRGSSVSRNQGFPFDQRTAMLALASRRGDQSAVVRQFINVVKREAKGEFATAWAFRWGLDLMTTGLRSPTQKATGGPECPLRLHKQPRRG